jgi:hypothetical protein
MHPHVGVKISILEIIIKMIHSCRWVLLKEMYMVFSFTGEGLIVAGDEFPRF